MYRTLLIIVCTAICTAACNSGSSTGDATNRKNGFTTELKTKEDSLYHDVLEGHDVGMAKTGALRRNITEIQRRLDSINKFPPVKEDSYKIQLLSTQDALNNANNEMNAWMDGFKIDSARDNKELRIQYLQSEKEKVTLVKEHILSSLQLADSVLKK